MNFRYFIVIFKEVVENRIDDPCGRLIRIIKYTKGKVKEPVMNCIFQLYSPTEEYQITQMLLKKKYGYLHRLLGSYRKEIKECQKLKLGDIGGFRKFSSFLVRRQSVTGRENWNLLDTADIICLLVSKLPDTLQHKWNRRIFNIRRNRHNRTELIRSNSVH